MVMKLSEKLRRTSVAPRLLTIFFSRSAFIDEFLEAGIIDERLEDGI